MLIMITSHTYTYRQDVGNNREIEGKGKTQFVMIA